MTEPIPYYDPFIPANPEDGNPPTPNDKVTWWDATAHKATPIMKYSLWPNWSRDHYAVDGTIILDWL